MTSLRNATEERGNETKFASLLLQVQTNKVANKVVFVVEGDSDVTMFNMVLRNEQFFYCTPACGKFEVINSLPILKNRISNNVYGVVDADFDNLVGTSYSNIFMTDKHDAEILMLHSEFMTDFITEHTKTDTLLGINIDETSEQLMNNLMEICHQIGLIKLACKMLNLNVMFKGLNYFTSNSVSANGFNLTINIDNLIDSALSRSPRVNAVYRCMILDKYNELASAGHCMYQTANGHDFCLLLSQVFSQPFSSDKNVNDKAVERYLRSKYTTELFKETKLYQKMIATTGIDIETEKVA
ncbi:DUF4435 domain-containing protein [Vibrio cholerae]|uniref:DUF4435 domain-containing protein n=1 Tax=Vibrio cholerae TaxID=666 RepID=UPI00115D93D3|nr:DUF4435 domain-containing protein [Vibrio cholerae]TQP32829.1 DUF4435 domain-containing protein [Vibrio cholerae]